MRMSGARPDIDPRGRYNESDAARLLGVNRCTLYRWRQAGIISPRPQKHTGRPRYVGADLLELFDAVI